MVIAIGDAQETVSTTTSVTRHSPQTRERNIE
jgi:hypothetical protein